MKKLISAMFLLPVCISVHIAQEPAGGGVSTGEAKVYSSRRTTGVVDPSAPAVFHNVASESALSSFNCVSGGKEKEYILETTACTVAVFDYDNDGKPDIYLLSGSTIDVLKGKGQPPKSALFKNLGDWKFKDVTAEAGLENLRWAMGVAVADYNNDGYSDVFVSNYGKARLYKNNGNGTFTDVAEKAGIDLDGWFTGATFGDFDKDGRLDLFVPSYLKYDIADLPPSPLTLKEGSGVSNYCQFRGQPVMCGPRGLQGGKDYLFRQKSDGTFEDVGKSVGVGNDGDYYGFSSVFVDIDDDHDLDLLVVNDSTPKQLYINNGGKFEEFGYPSGIALNENGREQAGMGLGVGDFDNDGRVDFHITNFSDDSNTLYRNEGDDNFTDITSQAGLSEASIPFLGWGTSFLDFNNDGWLDLIVGNGHVYPVVDKYQWGTSFAQQMLLFQSLGKDQKGRVHFERVGAAPDSPLAQSFNVRGLATADFDGDGRIDIVTNNMDSGPALLKNISQNQGNWLRFKLSSADGPRDAIGAVIFVRAGGITHRFDMTSGGGYASQNEQIAHFGLGTADSVEEIKIIWPDGKTEFFEVPSVNKLFNFEKGKGSSKVIQQKSPNQ